MRGSVGGAFKVPKFASGAFKQKQIPPALWATGGLVSRSESHQPSGRQVVGYREARPSLVENREQSENNIFRLVMAGNRGSLAPPPLPLPSPTALFVRERACPVGPQIQLRWLKNQFVHGLSLRFTLPNYQTKKQQTKKRLKEKCFATQDDNKTNTGTLHTVSFFSNCEQTRCGYVLFR